MDALLSLEDVNVSFDGVHAVRDLSFAVDNGELLGLIGPNGAGKTTVMRAITGAVTPASGHIRFRKTAITRLPTFARVRLGMGLSQQIVKPFSNMSALDNVAFAAGLRHTGSVLRSLTRVSRSRERRAALTLLERLDIHGFAGERPNTLPLGVLKRLELARALALEPKLLLLDEPLAGLNHTEAAQIADTISGVVDGGVTVVLIEHNLGEVIRVCTRLLVIDNGVKIAAGAPADVVADAAVRAAYLGK